MPEPCWHPWTVQPCALRFATSWAYLSCFLCARAVVVQEYGLCLHRSLTLDSTSHLNHRQQLFAWAQGQSHLLEVRVRAKRKSGEVDFLCDKDWRVLLQAQRLQQPRYRQLCAPARSWSEFCRSSQRSPQVIAAPQPRAQVRWRLLELVVLPPSWVRRESVRWLSSSVGLGSAQGGERAERVGRTSQLRTVCAQLSAHRRSCAKDAMRESAERCRLQQNRAPNAKCPTPLSFPALKRVSVVHCNAHCVRLPAMCRRWVRRRG